MTLERQIVRYVERVTPCDLVLQSHEPTLGVSAALAFPGSVRDEITRLPQVGRICGLRNVLLPYQGDWLMLAAYDSSCLTEVVEGRMAGKSAESLCRQLKQGGVAVSSNLAHFHNLSVGDAIELMTPAGEKAFPILRIVEDYTWPRGTVLLDREIYRSHWSDDALTYLHVAAKPGAPVDELRQAVTSCISGRHQISAYSSTEIRSQVSKLLRQWFRLADTQIIVAQVVGAMGVANSVLISLLSRSRQVALLVAIGASSRQICASLAWEAGILCMVSAVVGIALGLWQLWWPASWVVESETGYHLAPVMPWNSLILVFLAGVVISLLASFVPIAYARRTNLVAAIGYE